MPDVWLVCWLVSRSVYYSILKRHGSYTSMLLPEHFYYVHRNSGSRERPVPVPVPRPVRVCVLVLSSTCLYHLNLFIRMYFSSSPIHPLPQSSTWRCHGTWSRRRWSTPPCTRSRTWSRRQWSKTRKISITTSLRLLCLSVRQFACSFRLFVCLLFANP